VLRAKSFERSESAWPPSRRCWPCQASISGTPRRVYPGGAGRQDRLAGDDQWHWRCCSPCKARAKSSSGIRELLRGLCAAARRTPRRADVTIVCAGTDRQFSLEEPRAPGGTFGSWRSTTPRSRTTMPPGRPPCWSAGTRIDLARLFIDAGARTRVTGGRIRGRSGPLCGARRLPRGARLSGPPDYQDRTRPGAVALWPVTCRECRCRRTSNGS